MPTRHKSQRTPLSTRTNAQPLSKSAPKGPDQPPSPRSNEAGDALHVPAPVAPGSTGLDYKQVQKDEIEVLQSIFMDDFKRVQISGAWNTSDEAFKLRLKPLSDEELSCILSVVLTATYPKSLPQLKLIPSANLSSDHVQRLDQIIRDMPRQLLGQEMIYEIATSIQDALEDVVQGRLADRNKPSLDQERAIKVMTEQKKAEQEEEETRQRLEQEAIEKQEKLEQEIEKELKRQREQARETHERRRMSALVDESAVDLDTDGCVAFDRTIKTKPADGGAPCTFRKVCGMVKIAQGPVTSVFTVRPAFPAYESRNFPLVLKCADIVDRFDDASEGKRRIQALEQDLNGLRGLRHPNIIELYEAKITRSSGPPATSPPNAPDDPSAAAGWKAYILTEYANKGSLRGLLEMVETVSADTARSWTIALLEGLDYIHRQGAVHNGIRAENVMLSRKSPGDSIVPKFSDVSFGKSLHDILQPQNSYFLDTAHSAYWLPPETAGYPEQSLRKTGRKSDIWNLGIVFLQMIFGLKVSETYESPQRLMESMELSDSLSDFLESVFRTDPKKRPTAFELLPSEFLRNDDPINFATSPRAPSPTLSRAHWYMASQSHRRHRRSSAVGPGGMSRYANDFVELGMLGKGGYGHVVKARNRLDGREYAIKQITRTSGAKLTEILSEVMLLSRLNHKYVVRYFTAWLEEEDSLGRAGVVDTTDGEDSTAISFTGSSRSHTQDEQSEDEGADECEKESECDIDIQFGASASASGLDFISSGGGYPQAHFGYGSDDSDESENTEDEESTESKSQKPNTLKRIASNERKRAKVTLYIQMSLAERLTLRDRIRQGLSLDECWKLLHQVLEGLAHIHGLGIIHRDLKPENIFIDLAGDPQIGDFGLATNDRVVNTLAKSESQVSYGESDLTTNVGTTFYVAPELRSRGTGNYNEKVDMYSLGIIFFEMVYPLSTGMERGQVLGKLREPGITFPSEFWSEKRRDQGEIIKSLLNHDASKRPSALELLNSGKLPFMVEDKAIRHALRSLADPNTPYHNQVMQALFSQSTQEYKDHTYDADAKQLTWQDLVLQAQVKGRLTEIFRTHGAVETTRPLLMPRSIFHARDTSVVQLMDPHGTLVQLPHNLTLPNARFLARQQAPAPKTFTFGTVYRENSGGGQPRSHGEVDFDIISSDSLDLPLKEAEVIKVIDEVIDAFPSLKRVNMCYHISHSTLLDAIMEFCRIKAPERAGAKEILSRLNHRQWTWPKIRNELATSTPSILATSLDDLARFDWRDEPEKAFERLQTLFEGNAAADKVHSVLVHVRSVVTYVRQFNVQRKVYVNPLGTWNDKFYRGGVVFQCVHDTKKRDVFAAGGRYDSLILEHRPKARGTSLETHAVGFNLGWEQLFSSMSKYNHNLLKTSRSHPEDDYPYAYSSSGAWTSRRCDVLVSAFDSSALCTHGASILHDLWTAGISADLAPDTSPLAPHDSNAGWLVTIKQDHHSGSSTLRVKTLLAKHQDVELKQSELIAHLRSEISADRERRRAHPANPPATLRHNSADHFAPTLTAAAAQPDEIVDRVRILVGDRKTRKVNRGAIIDAAQRAAFETAGALQRAPIAAVEVREDLLEQIARTSIKDSEGWKRVAQNAPAADRKYVTQIQELLEEMKTEGTEMAWVFSSRLGEGRCVYLA